MLCPKASDDSFLFEDPQGTNPDSTEPVRSLTLQFRSLHPLLSPPSNACAEGILTGPQKYAATSSRLHLPACLSWSRNALPVFLLLALLSLMHTDHGACSHAIQCSALDTVQCGVV